MFPGIALLCLLAIFPGTAAGEIRVQDDLGQSIVLPGPAKRIISLYGAFNEILAGMGLTHSIVARTKADELPGLDDRPGIGTHMRPNVELVLGLAPDVVLQIGGRRGALLAVEQISAHGIPVAVFSPVTVDELFSVIVRIGRLTREEEKALSLIERMKVRLDAVRCRLQDLTSRPSVFFEVRYPNLLGAGQGSIVNDVIVRAGGVNCVRSEKKIVRLGEEALLGLNPDAYVVQKGPMNANPLPPSKRPIFKSLKAVQAGRVFEVDEKLYSRPGPRIVRAVEELAKFLHPEIMRDTKALQ
ncbi:MAG: ABC transporter substrate-binding protein [Thermodesulfobacteriota bacterium]|nr:ABC transporter substrate-binding protein [Thermodesulfobacteriota bacterium]